MGGVASEIVADDRVLRKTVHYAEQNASEFDDDFVVSEIIGLADP